MTTLAAAPLTESQQMLIDSRLDTIDRVLLGRVPRSDRVAIVREVESQIHELLAERDSAEISRDDVIEVLRRLDRPEAYLPEDAEIADVPRSPLKVSPITSRSATPRCGNHGLIGGILGLCSFGLIPLTFFASYFFGSTAGKTGVIFLENSLLGFIASIVALVLAIQGRRQGAWPILGMIFGAVSLPVWVFGLMIGLTQALDK